MAGWLLARRPEPLSATQCFAFPLLKQRSTDLQSGRCGTRTWHVLLTLSICQIPSKYKKGSRFFSNLASFGWLGIMILWIKGLLLINIMGQNWIYISCMYRRLRVHYWRQPARGCCALAVTGFWPMGMGRLTGAGWCVEAPSIYLPTPLYWHP